MISKKRLFNKMVLLLIFSGIMTCYGARGGTFNSS